MNKLFGDLDKPLFVTSLAIIVFLTLFSVCFTDIFGAFWGALNSWICTNFGWFYLLIAGMAVLFCFIIAFTKVGKLKLGKDNEKPEHSTFSWIAMLFSAGMGVALYFWCVSEPLWHYHYTPYLAEPETNGAIVQAMTIITMHNGIHGWALFAFVGLGIGYAAYRFGKPLSFSSSLYGLIGDRINGPWGKLVNFLFVIVTIAGLTTSLGMAVLSISYMVSNLTGLSMNLMLEIAVMFAIGLIFILSVSSGLKKGMARISDWNVYLAIAFGLFVFIVGPSVAILNLCNQTLGNFINNFAYMTLWSDYGNTTDGWLGSWTVFYWAWWIAWSPFVGGFLARISKGRTIRQFLLFSMLLPTALCFIWLNIMGGFTFSLDSAALDNIWQTIQVQNEAGLALMLNELPLSGIVTVVVIANVLLFIATSADAGANYISIVFAKGIPTPKIALRLIVSLVLLILPIALIIGDGLKALQTMSIVMALPFSAVLVLVLISILKMINMDKKEPENKLTDDAII